ncbi:ABC transporter permease, partial [Micromonospora sp. NPDC005313]
MSGPALAEATAPVVPDRATPRRSRARASRRWRRAVSPVVLVLVWEAAAGFGLLAPEKLPAPSAVLAAGWRLARDGTLG